MSSLEQKVAVIIVNYNGRQYLKDCLDSLFNLDYPKENFKIFLIDNASTDDSIEFVKNSFGSVEIIANQKNLGFAEGNNIGIKKAIDKGFDFVYLINQDTVSEADSLTKLVLAAQADDKIAAVQPRIMLWPQKDKVNSLGNSIHYLGFGFSAGGYQKFSGDLELKEVAYASGAAVLIKTSALQRVGLFEPDFFMYHEDLDLGWRLHLAGYKVILVPASVVYHKYSFAKSMQKYYFMERNRLICLLENYKIRTLILIFPAWLLMEMGLFIFSIKSGFWREKLRVYAYFLRSESWQKIIRGKRIRKEIRVKEDRDVVRFFAGKIEFQEIDNPLLKYVVNPLFNLYWQFIKHLIIW